MKKLHLFKRTLLLLALIVGCVNYGWADATVAYSTGFESSESFTASTSYNQTKTGGATGKQWTFYYGTPSTNDPLTGSQSAQCRYYGTANDKEPYAQMNFNVANVKTISFSSKVENTNLYLILQYSENNGSSWKDANTYNVTTSKATYSYTHSTTFENVRFRFLVKHTKTISSGNQKFWLDDIVITEPEEIKTLSSIAVKTDFTTTEYKVGSAFSSDGLTLTATYDDSSTATISSGFTFKIGETALADEDALSSTGDKTVTITYGGKTTTTSIYVGALAGIDVTTPPTKTTYNEGQTFDPTGMVVTATFSTGGSHADWTEVVNDYTYSPTAALVPANTSITISYTWNEDEETATQDITVNPGTAYTVTFDAGTGSCGTESLTEGSVGAGVTLPTATIGVTGWSFVGWAETATTNTENKPTTYAAAATYKPEDNCTLYAVYKFSEGTEGEYKRATSVSEITTAGKVVIVSNKYSKMLDNTFAGNIAAPEEESSVITADAKDVFVLTSNNTDGYTLTNGLKTIGVTGTDDNTVISNTTTNSSWTINVNTSTTNVFYFLNKAKSKLCLEHDGTNWCVYAPSTPSSNTYNCLKVYIPNFAIVYNSNPAAIINPTVAFTTAGDKALYVKNENSYTNAANVTGIAKTPVYTSSDATVATVSDAGVVTALKAGMTTITATVAAEVGVNTEASASYEVTVKDASNIAGLKAITDGSSVVAFTADLTDAVVTYVDGDYAYIQDAYGAVYASCGSSLTAGNKINGAISGSIKAAYKIDEITAIDLDEATVTEDGIIPAADVKTLAEIKEAGTNYDGKLVTVNGLKVTTALTDEQNGDITDDDGKTSFKLVCPYEGVNADRYAEGNITGFISIYNASTYRLNIYDQSQIVLTKNAPTAQTLSFESDAVELDEVTPAFAAFTGQTVKGAIGDVTYSIEDGDDESGVVSSINASTGDIVLSGAYGTATITATAAAKEVTVAGVTTPYTETAKTYTVTVNPRYMVTFSVNGVETVLRQATSGATIAVPTPAACGDYTFVGWSTSTVAPTDDKPSMTDLGATVTPENNNGKYYAVYAIATGTPLVEHTSTFTIALASAPSSPVVDDGSSWTWSNLTFTTTNNGACINKTNGTVTVTLPDGGKAVSLNITKTNNPWAGEAAVVLKDASGNTLKTYTGSSLTYNFTEEHNQSESYTLTNTTGKNAWIDHITFEYTTGGVSYSDYRTSLPTVEVTITDAQYATFCYESELNVEGTGVTAYTASANGEGNAVTLTKISDGIIPANTGVILFAESAGNYTINVSETDKEAIAGNDLVGVTTRTSIPETSADKYNYIFSKKGDEIGFYRASGAYLLPNRAYLSTSKRDAAAREFMAIMFDEGETTSLREVRGLKSDVRGEFYNLNGQRVTTPVKGNIYIVNGKKVMFK